jgi:NitT/TauT family transport system substrate-binding protein
MTAKINASKPHSSDKTQSGSKPSSLWHRRSVLSLSGLFAIALFISVAFSACSLQQKPLQLKVGITTWPGFDIILYAQEAGLFKQRNLNVELIRFENQQDSTRAMLRGALDITFASIWDVVQSDPGNDKPTVILVTNVSYGSDGIVAQPAIKSVEALRGKRVGAKLGTVNHLILLEALKLHQIKPSEVEIEDLSNETAVEMMEKGKLDAAVIWQPLLGETARKINGNIVYTTRELDSLVVDSLVSRTTTIQNKRAELTQFISAWLDVMHRVETKPTEVYQVVAKQLDQSGASFGEDYAGLKKGDVAMQRHMFQSPDGLKTAIMKISNLLETDPRAGRLPRQDIEINSELVSAAIEEWQP